MLVAVVSNSLVQSTDEESCLCFSMATLPLIHRLRYFSFVFSSGVWAAFSADDISKISLRPGYVTDLAGVIPPAAQQRLETLCTELEQKTGAQLCASSRVKSAG